MLIKKAVRKGTASKFLGITERTYLNWRNSHDEYKKGNNEKQDHPIIDLLEKYFSEEEIKEFIETGKIEKFEYIDYLYSIEKNKLLQTVKNILRNHSDIAHHILNLIHKYEKRYHDLKKSHQAAQNEMQDHIRFGENKEFDEILEYPEGYMTTDEYLSSIIFTPDKLSEIIGKKLPPRDLFDLQYAIREIIKEDLVPVIKKHMEYLIEEVSTYKSNDEIRQEWDLEEQKILESFNDLADYLYGTDDPVDDDYVGIIWNDIEKYKEMYPEKSYIELIEMATKARPLSGHIDIEKSGIDLSTFLGTKNEQSREK